MSATPDALLWHFHGVGAIAFMGAYLVKELSGRSFRDAILAQSHMSIAGMIITGLVAANYLTSTIAHFQ